MNKKNKGLVDEHEHGIILNESGTSVDFGWDAEEDNAKDETTLPQETQDKATIQPSANDDDVVLSGEE